MIVLFSSENDEVATVDEAGKITAHEEGEAVITALIEGYPDSGKTILVTVLGFPLTLEGEDSVYVGETIALAATDRDSADNSVLWESLNPDVATVDDFGVVTGVAPGVAVIKISSKITAAALEKEITVIKPEPASVEISIKGNPRIIVLNEIRLNHKIASAGANQSVTWRSSDENRHRR